MRSRWLIESVDFLRRHSVSSIDVVSKDASRSNCTWFLQWGTNHNYIKHFCKWNSFFGGKKYSLKWVLEHFKKFDSWIHKDLEHHTASPTNVCITFEKKEYAIKCQWYLFAMSLLAAPFIWKHCAPTSRKDKNDYWRRLHNFSYTL